MKEIKYVITDKEGIHARPAGMLVKEASLYSSAITIKSGEKAGDLKRIFAVMSLGVKKGDEVVITIEGNDETEAATAIENFLKNNL